jgi:hypothetical protein
MSRDNVTGIATELLSCGPDGLGKKSGKGQVIFPFSKNSNPLPRHNFDHSHPPSSEVKTEWSFTSSIPILLRGVNKGKLIEVI